MALVVRRYAEAGPSNLRLQNIVSPSATAIQRFPQAVCDVQIDDALPGIIETLDEFMVRLGYVFAPMVPESGNPRGYVRGFVTSWTSVSSVTIGMGDGRSSDNLTDIVLAAPVVVDITVAGAGGLDAGAEAANTWYYAHVIADSTGVNPTRGLLSASATAPVLPPGYDRSRRVGSVRNTAASNFRQFATSGFGSERTVQYTDAITNRQVLVGGAAVVVTAVVCATLIPPTSRVGGFQYGQRGTVGANLYDDPANALATMQRTLVPGGMTTDWVRISAAREIGYANAAAGGLVDIWVTGYEESL